MKTTTKFIAASLILILTVILTSAFNKSNDTSKKFLLVRTTEYFTGGGSRIVIINEEGNTEEIDLGKYKGDGMAENGKVINKVLNDLSVKGYDLHSTNGGLAEGKMHSEYIFIKK